MLSSLPSFEAGYHIIAPSLLQRNVAPQTRRPAPREGSGGGAGPSSQVPSSPSESSRVERQRCAIHDRSLSAGRGWEAVDVQYYCMCTVYIDIAHSSPRSCTFPQSAHFPFPFPFPLPFPPSTTRIRRCPGQDDRNSRWSGA